MLGPNHHATPVDWLTSAFLHRDYWRQADFADNPDGFAVEVESDYLPENLVNGTW